MRSIIVDAGPLIALFRKRDRHHARVTRFLASNRASLVSTLPVITEVCHFLNGAGKVALLTWIVRGGLALHPISPEDLPEIGAVLERYADQEMDFADATLVWVADLINTLDVMTIDRRDFLVYRSRSGAAFTLVLS